MGGKSVCHMALGIRYVSSQLIRGIEKLCKELPSFQFFQIPVCFLQGIVQLCRRHPHRFSGNQRLTGTGCCSGIRGHFRIGTHIFNICSAKPCGLGHHLNKYSCAALSDIGSGAVQFHLSVMDDQFRPSFIRKAHAHAGIFHGTGNPCPSRIALICVFYRQERFL